MKKTLSIIGLTALVLAYGAQRGVAEAQPQPPAGPSTGEELMPPFNPAYYAGEWEVEWSPPDTSLFPADTYTGVETVDYVANRFFQVHVEMEGEEGATITGDGMMFYEYGLGGQSAVRYMVYDNGISLLQYGDVGGDLGGYYSHFWETPTFEHNEHAFELKGRSFYVSPAAYRINQEISIDGESFFNFGTMWLTRRAESPAPPAP